MHEGCHPPNHPRKVIAFAGRGLPSRVDGRFKHRRTRQELENVMKHNRPAEAHQWWQVMPALPASPETQHHAALRRIWADHTINTRAKGRGYYHWGTEDHITPSLFQIWAIFDNPQALRALLTKVGARPVGELRHVQWAYACEETIARGTFPGFSGRILIPDIVVHYEDEAGGGLISFEVKKPGVAPNEKDATKLSTYTRLDSMREIARKHRAFLVSAESVPVAMKLDPHAGVLSWNDMQPLLLEAACCEFSCDVYSLVGPWIKRAFARHGIGSASAPKSASGEVAYGTEAAFEAIDATGAPLAVRQFLKGSEVVEAHWRNEKHACPAAWMTNAPTREELSERKAQSSADRRLNRWSPRWRHSLEQLRI